MTLLTLPVACAGANMDAVTGNMPDAGWRGVSVRSFVDMYDENQHLYWLPQYAQVETRA